MLATASVQVCVPLGHSSLYFNIEHVPNDTNAAVIMDIVLEASASGRGGLEGVFLAGSGSLRPHTVLTLWPRFCLGPGLAQLSSKQSTSESIHPQT